MKFPETDPATYRMWVREEWYDLILDELGDLLSFVRANPIVGLRVGEIRGACFVGFGVMYNRKVWLYMNEIEAYNELDEGALKRKWELSGLERP